MRVSGLFSVVLLIFLTLAVAILGYIVVSSSVSLEHARMEQEQQRQREHVLQILLLKTASDLSRNQIMALVKESFGKDYIIKEEENKIMIDDTVLKFEGDKLKSISTINDDL